MPVLLSFTELRARRSLSSIKHFDPQDERSCFARPLGLRIFRRFAAARDLAVSL